MSYSIRAAHINDIHHWQELSQRTFTQTFGHLYSHEDLQYFLESSYSIQALTEIFQHTDTILYFIENNNNKVTFGDIQNTDNLLILGISSTCVSCLKVINFFNQHMKNIDINLNINVIIISNNDTNSKKIICENFRYFVDPDIKLVKHLGIAGTPFAVFIEEGGILEYSPVYGEDMVVEFLSDVFFGDMINNA